MPGARVEVTDVSRSYGPTTVLSDITFTIEPGEIVALSGASGSGKTTLLQLIGSLDRPTTGTIRVDGVAVERLTHPVRYRRETVGFVFQLHHLLPALSAEANIELPMLAAHVSRRERRQRARALLEEVGLGDRADAFPSALSGGERQRIAIARALAGEPRLILADEPTGALDSVASERIWALLGQARTDHGTTVLIASHDPSLTEHVDRSLHLVDGRLVSGAPSPAGAAPGLA